MIIKHIFSILSYVLRNRLLLYLRLIKDQSACQRLMYAINVLIISEIYK